MNQKKNALEICKIFFEAQPDPKIELKYKNNLTLLIAILLSAQSTDKMVNRCTESLFAKCQSPKDFLDMGYENLIQYIKYIGMYRRKAQNIILLNQQLIERHNGKIPDDFTDLIQLAGVGPKTANVFLNTAFNKPTIGVDRHIFRVVHKINITSGKDTNEVAKNLSEVIPKKYHRQIHHWLVLHGRYICKARNQLCEKCIISKYCKTYQDLKKKS